MKAKRILSAVLALLMLMSALFVAVSAEESLYTDVKVKRWSYKDIMYVSEKGLMNGKSEGIFAPAETMTRAMVVTVFYRLAGSPAVEYAATFTDVKANKWFTDAVIWAADNGIVNGTGDAKYEPMANVTREQLATIIMRYAQFAYVKTEKAVDITGYADYKRIHDYAREAMAWANAEGLITGKTEDTLAPREGATREQFAAILHRFDTAEFDYELVYNTPVYGQNYKTPEYELVTDADIYVAVDGNDNNPGTFEKPVKTFHRARDMVREMDKTGKDGITVAFKAGDYGVLDEVAFESEDAGTAECPITYCAYGDGDVIFRNGIEIPETSFEPITDEEAKLFPEEAISHIYKADLTGKIDRVTINHVLFSGNGVADLARFPNKHDDGSDNYYKDFTSRIEEEGKTEAEYDKVTISGPLPAVMGKFTTFEGMYITGYLRTGWFQDTFPVKSVDLATKTITFDFANHKFEEGWDLNEYPLAYEERMPDMIYFQNLAEFLDVPGEYWVDNDTHTLYVYDPVGDYAIPTDGQFMFLGYGADHLTFRGLDFITTLDRAVTGFSDHITFDSCTFGNVGGNAAIFFESAMYFTATNNEFYNFVCGGINIRSDCNLRGLENSHITITNNYFHDFTLPQYFDGAVGIQLFKTVGTVIAHNEFVNASHGAIRYDTCIDTVIEYNVFDNMMKNTQDFGAVYTWEDIAYRDNVIRYNLFTNMRYNDAVHGIYFDGSSGDIVYGNLFYNVGGDNIIINGGRDNQIHDNITINTTEHGVKFITTIDHGYNYVNGTGGEDHYDYSISYIHNKPAEGEPFYDVWVKRWPILYEYTTHLQDYGSRECILTMINTVKNNVRIGTEFYSGATFETHTILENNREYAFDVNPYFADPTHGDYTIVNGADDFEYLFDFEKVGRQ